MRNFQRTFDAPWLPRLPDVNLIWTPFGNFRGLTRWPRIDNDKNVVLVQVTITI